MKAELLRPSPLWHALPPSEVLARLETAASGLTQREASARLARLGANVLPRATVMPAWRILLRQCRGVVVGLLAAALIAAWFLADRADAAAIGGVLVLNIGLGFAMELRSRRAVDSLAALETRRATVLRDGVRVEIDARDVVPGDVIALESGQAVPADARIFGGDIRVNESTLTGESVPVSKQVDRQIAPETPLPERQTMVYAGTIVQAGAALAAVVATGAGTELGGIGRLVAGTPTAPTQLEAQLDRLGRQLVWVALAIAVLSALLAWRQGVAVADIVQGAIALAVAAVPEGLPAVATIALALAVHRMARQHALVRRLPAAESLGSITVLCTDKTGTLTAGTMAVTTIHTLDAEFEVSGTSFEPVGDVRLNGQPITPHDFPDLEQALRIGVLASRGDAVLTDRGWTAQGDPTDSALVVAARKVGLERTTLMAAMPEVGEIPFSSDRRWAGTFCRSVPGDEVRAFVKGAPSRVLARCRFAQRGATATPLDAETAATIERHNETMAANGLRVLALASGVVTRPEEAAVEGLTFVGLVGIADPPAPGVRQTIDAFRHAGIRTVMITGDQRGTAEAIGRQLGLQGVTVEGRTLDAAPDSQLPAILEDAVIFSRISPAAKLRLVEGYQRAGEVVAMIGDGVNDAAALKKADIGVTMGRRGTDVARDNAAVVLQDDRFETIGAAIAEGRLVFENIRRFVFYLFSCNLAEVFVLLGTSAMGFPLPLAPIHVLWLNLVTDTVPAISLAFEPGGGDLMARPPRAPRTAIISWPFMRSIVGYAALMAVSVFALMVSHAWFGTPVRVAMTMNFMALGLTQIFHLGNARDIRPVLQLPRVLANRHALAAVAIATASLVAVTWIPALSRLVRVTPLSAGQWLVVGVCSLVPALVGQGIKVARWGLSHHGPTARTVAAAIVALLIAVTTASPLPSMLTIGQRLRVDGAPGGAYVTCESAARTS
jgi:P-type Ca2+ transporter type 2C